MICVSIKDTETGKQLNFSRDKTLPVTVVQRPLQDVKEPIPKIRYLKDSSDSQDMTVDGSSTSQDFFIQGIAERDIFIKSLNIGFADDTSIRDPRYFYSSTTLTNGIELLLKSRSLGTISIVESIKSQTDFARATGGRPYIESGEELEDDPMRPWAVVGFASTSGGSSADGYIHHFDFKECFGLQFGIKLEKDTKDQLIIRIKDNLTSLVLLDACACYTEI